MEARKNMGDAPEMDPLELRQRVLYALMLPVVRMGFVFAVPLKEVGELLQMAYYHETRRRELKMKEAGSLLQVSMRKVAQLSKQLKLNFAQVDQEHGLPRRVEFTLWSAPLSAVKLAQALEVPQEEVEEVLERMEAAGRVLRHEGRTVTWSVKREEGRLVQDAWLARLDALHNLLGSVTNAVHGRFFDQEARAFARTLQFRVRAEEVDALRALYEEQIWKTLAELDQRAKGDPDAVSMDLSVVWAPHTTLETLVSDPGSPEGETP